jgi:gamma-glutamyltranspeptidase/glutathione hydrolase
MMITGRSVTHTTHGIVVSPHYLATMAGVRVLMQGGSAVDAAIAANATLTVVLPNLCSLGGDLFMLIWSARERKLTALNGSGRAPQQMTPTLFAQRGLSSVPARGPLPITVPGVVDGWTEAIERYGHLSLADVLTPAISYAEEGFPVSAHFLRSLAVALPETGGLPGFSAKFLPNGRLPRTGEIWRQPDVARSLKLIAQEGRDVFYRGDLGQRLVQGVQEAGGVLSMDDLRAHRSNWVEPLSTSYRGYDIYEFPPNSQGITVLMMLNILEGYDLRGWGYQSADALHVLLEAKKLAFADRDRYLSDPDFVDIPVQELLDKDYAARQRQRIDLRRAAPIIDPGVPAAGDTVYLCVVDEEGNAVSLIQSLFFPFGSGIVAGDTGIVLQNRGHYFSLNPQSANYLQPGKRTLHTLAPAMAFKDGRPWLVFGTVGGDAQPQIHAQVLTDIIDFDLNPQEAVEAPRWRSTPATDAQGYTYADVVFATTRTGDATEGRTQGHIYEDVLFEAGFPEAALAELAARGHAITRGEPQMRAMGIAQVIQIDPESGVLSGGADPRADSLALGW